LVDSNAPKGEQFDVSIDVPLIEILIPAMLTDVLLSSCPTCEYEDKGGAESAVRIALRRKGAGKKELKPSRLVMLLPSTGGVVRAAKFSTLRQLAMSPAGGTVTWIE
jgi:hypothetical protein